MEFNLKERKKNFLNIIGLYEIGVFLKFCHDLSQFSIRNVAIEKSQDQKYS